MYKIYRFWYLVNHTVWYIYIYYNHMKCNTVYPSDNIRYIVYPLMIYQWYVPSDTPTSLWKNHKSIAGKTREKNGHESLPEGKPSFSDDFPMVFLGFSHENISFPMVNPMIFHVDHPSSANWGGSLLPEPLFHPGGGPGGRAGAGGDRRGYSGYTLVKAWWAKKTMFAKSYYDYYD